MFLPHDLQTEHAAQAERIRRTIGVKSADRTPVSQDSPASPLHASARLLGLALLCGLHTASGPLTEETGSGSLLLAAIHLALAGISSSQRCGGGA